MKMILDLDMDKCIACGACAVACMDQNDLDSDKTVPFRSVFSVEENGIAKTKFVYLSLACMHCENAPCIKACPAGCIQKDLQTQLTVYDNTNCIGCHSCAMACPFGAPSFAEDGKMVKCDGCVTRVQHGMKPACVKVCPFDALSMYTEEEYEAIRAKNALHTVVTAILNK